MSVLAKFECRQKTEQADSQSSNGLGYSIRFAAVNRGDAAEGEDSVFGKYTPSGDLTMYVRNSDAAAQLVPGRNYYLTLEEAP